MRVEKFTEILDAGFYTGVPDSQLKALCNYLLDRFGTDPSRHVIGANEGCCAALAAGYYLASGKTAVVYLQNSGEGNMLNPYASLLQKKVYGVPVLFVIGWRGEPGSHDEPQHIFQGEITLGLLELLDIPFYVVDSGTTEESLKRKMQEFRRVLDGGSCAAFVVRKGALTYEGFRESGRETACSGCRASAGEDHREAAAINGRETAAPDIPAAAGVDKLMLREEALCHVTAASGEDVVVSTTGRTSRELFEIREAKGQGHSRDFLTVGSMGHCSSIALGIALQKPHRRVWCVDGDGAVLMHMGALAVIADCAPENFIHVVINNGAHETVGGMPTAAAGLDLAAVAVSCGYAAAVSVERPEELDAELERAKTRKGPSMIEIKCSTGARKDLGRPDTPAAENRKRFMEFLRKPGQL